MKHIKTVTLDKALTGEEILAILDRIFAFALDVVEATGKDKSGTS